MSHELAYNSDGTASFAHMGAKGWHGEGNQAESSWTIERWIEAAGFDWEILRSRVRYCTDAADVGNPANWLEFAGKVALHRSDNHHGLGIVSDNYKPVQPRQYMRDTFAMFDAAGIERDTAGMLYAGAQYFISGAIQAESTILDPRDSVKAYLMTCTACDGTMATEYRYTAQRTVCKNTMQYARTSGAAKHIVSHRSEIDIDAVKSALGLEKARTAFNDTIAEMKRLAETTIPNGVAIDSLGQLLVKGWREMSISDRIKQSERDGGALVHVGRLVLDGRAVGSDLDGVQGTAWGWLNGVTEYVDHHAATRGDDKADNRLSSALFGKGAETKMAAFKMAGELADAYHGQRTVVAMPGAIAVGAVLQTAAAVQTTDGAGLLASFLTKPAKVNTSPII